MANSPKDRSTPRTTRRASTAGTSSFAPRWRRDRGTALFGLNCELGPDGHFTCDVDGAQVRSDGVHLSSDGLRWLAPWLAAQLQRVRS